MASGEKGRGCCGCLVLIVLVVGGLVAYTNRENLPTLLELLKPPPDVPPSPSPAPTPPVPPVTVRMVEVGDFHFAVIEAGRFVMGSPRDEPGHESSETEHEVTIPYAFGMLTHEVTADQYWRSVDVGHAVPAKDRNKPVASVSWDEAADFCRKLSDAHPGRRFRLPYEVEWEYACRAGQTRMFCVWVDGPDWSDLDEAVTAYRNGEPNRLTRRAKRVMNFGSDEAAAVGSRALPNAWGLYDMHGNVWEWCDTGPADADDAPSLNHRPTRGGSWVSTTCLDCRAAKRAWQRRGDQTAAIGFRIVLENP